MFEHDQIVDAEAIQPADIIVGLEAADAKFSAADAATSPPSAAVAPAPPAIAASIARTSARQCKRSSFLAGTMISLSVMTWGCRAAHLQSSWALQGHYICHAAEGQGAFLHLAILAVVSAAELFAAIRLARQFIWRRKVSPWVFVDLATLLVSTIYLVISWCSLTQVGCYPGEFLAMLVPYTNASLGLLIVVSIAEALHLAQTMRHRS